MAYSNKPRPLDTILKEVLERMPRRREMKRGMVLHFWPNVVGGQMARATRNLYFEGDKLIVLAENEAWRYEIHMNRFTIAKRLNEKVNGEVVSTILVRC
ncbi:MAG: DUF721 domain-containing protein [Balneolaceae bacterium]